MERLFIVSGHIKGQPVTYGYFKSNSGANACLDRQVGGFRSKGFKVEIIESEQEIQIYNDGQYYGYISVKSNILNP